MGSAERVVTIAVAHRWARPTWVISCRIVQSGQVGTWRVRSAPSMSWTSVAVLPVISSCHRSVLIMAIGGPFGGSASSRCRPAPAGGGGAGQPPQPQEPPQQPPPDGPGAALPADALPPTDTVESSFTVSSCPWGQVQGSDACAIGRLTSKVSPHARHRNS